MRISAKSGAALAAAAAGLMISGASISASFAADAMDAKGHCMGATACKGQGACKTAANACKGQNACKGTGFLELTKAECDKVTGGKFESTAMPEKKM